MSHHPAKSHSHHDRSKNDHSEAATAKEMLPFALYAAVPILITIFIAFYFGSL